MLQQTTVAAVIPKFIAWMDRFPNVQTLAEASEQETLAAWQGLGYYRRAKMLHAAAKQIASVGFPNDVAGWRRMPGVGAYTAGAVASIALGLPEPLVDTNVERVYARLTADPSTAPERTRRAWAWAAGMVPTDRPGDWNQALMELGATVCLPDQPLCGGCPLRVECLACQRGLQATIPAPKTKASKKEVSHRLWIPVASGLVGVAPLPTGAWWQGMWTFMLEEGTDAESALLQRAIPVERRSVGVLRHVVTQHRVTLSVEAVELQDPLASLEWRSWKDLADIPIPSPHRMALGRASNLLRDLGVRFDT